MLAAGDVGVFAAESGPAYTIQVPVHLSQAAKWAVTVNYRITGVTAIAHVDFTGSRNGRLTFPIGKLAETVAVSLLPNDQTLQPDKQIVVTLSASKGATVERSHGTVTIHNEAPPPSGAVTPFDWGFDPNNDESLLLPTQTGTAAPWAGLSVGADHACRDPEQDPLVLGEQLVGPDRRRHVRRPVRADAGRHCRGLGDRERGRRSHVCDPHRRDALVLGPELQRRGG